MKKTLLIMLLSCLSLTTLANTLSRFIYTAGNGVFFQQDYGKELKLADSKNTGNFALNAQINNILDAIVMRKLALSK